VVKRPVGLNAFEFCVVAGLRAAQLQRGCTPRVPPCDKIAVTAQHEVAERRVVVGERVATDANHEAVES